MAHSIVPPFSAGNAESGLKKHDDGWCAVRGFCLKRCCSYDRLFKEEEAPPAPSNENSSDTEDPEEDGSDTEDPGLTEEDEALMERLVKEGEDYERDLTEYEVCPLLLPPSRPPS